MGIKSSTGSSYNLSILVVDDHPTYRHGLVDILRSVNIVKNVDEAGDGNEAFNWIERKRYDIILLDIEMPVLNGLNFMMQYKNRNVKGDPRIIIISSHSEMSKVMAVYEAGAHGFIMKDTPVKQMKQALISVAEGNVYFSENISKMIIQSSMDKRKASRVQSELTHREKEVLVGLCKRMSNQQIGEQLFISEFTAKTHRANIRRKLDLKNTADCILYAIANGLFVV